VDHPFEVAFRTTPSTANIKDYFGATTKASSYRVDSLVPNYTTQELRQAGEEYPEWVLDRYLALPANLPARVRSLALELTAAEATPYDRAVAIEKHLRQFPYSLDVPLPPRDEDVVDYFLFTLQEGYCDYYASAMVVLARAAGIPARLVTGYTSATFDSTNNRYIVKESEAHAWVDIYFPGYGWIEFEPTAGRPPIERQENLPDTVSMQPSDQLEEITAYRTRLNWTIWIISLGIGWIVIFWSIALYRWLESWHLRRIPPKQAIQKIYNQFRDRARVLSSDHIPGVTPHEFAEILKIRLTGLTKRPRLLASLSNAPNEILSLTEVYTRAVYSQERLSPQESQLAIQTWRKLRSRLVLAQWLLRFRI
jgi:transglutaminase-like putative cysteine protease